jgi:hypothetical protein
VVMCFTLLFCPLFLIVCFTELRAEIECDETLPKTMAALRAKYGGEVMCLLLSSAVVFCVLFWGEDLTSWFGCISLNDFCVFSERMAYRNIRSARMRARVE